MATIQWLTHRYGITYNSRTALDPTIVLAYQRPAMAKPTPISEANTRCHSSGRKRALVGKKWLLPRGYFEGGFLFAKLPWLAVILAMRYQGKPTSCWRTMRAKVYIGESSAISSRCSRSTPMSDAYLPFCGGT